MNPDALLRALQRAAAKTPKHRPGPSGYLLMASKCDECLMTPQRIVSARRAAQIIRDTLRKDCSFLCHKGTQAGRDIACRGHHDATGGGQMARIAGRLGVVVEINPETLEPMACPTHR